MLRFSKAIDRGEPNHESILGVTLDSDVYGAPPGFPDFRIFASRGQEVPFVLERVTESRMQTHRDACQSEVVSLHEQGTGIEIRVKLQPDTPAADGLGGHSAAGLRAAGGSLR